jgi:hypothetical protein
LFDDVSHTAQVGGARHDFVPAIGNGDERLLQIPSVKTEREKQCAMGCPVRPVDNLLAPVLASVFQ